MVCALKAI